ncbi:uncharacterized protein BDZ83DRAFT_653793 [Colletotrichum acutatum]|uniref:Secreted protein n=1 Tax=Glomerella acutata TaxID=27357 RepID=A0AAD8UJH6_GLOAC|nr:uncharacterized protein BDZ83DRAFT_653793 [Colletotrichum acutatum]KAK1722561.1 hypothetical protein BDZ83DRAFT_653793 [Colletotrichum acutatum]
MLIFAVRIRTALFLLGLAAGRDDNAKGGAGGHAPVASRKDEDGCTNTYEQLALPRLRVTGGVSNVSRSALIPSMIHLIPGGPGDENRSNGPKKWEGRLGMIQDDTDALVYVRQLCYAYYVLRRRRRRRGKLLRRQSSLVLVCRTTDGYGNQIEAATDGRGLEICTVK